jgi:hypothetical protein
LHWLATHCGHRPHVHNGPSGFDPWFQQKLQLHQPLRVALESIAAIDHLVNYAKVALDWTFDSNEDRDLAFEFVAEHHIKSHHRDQGIRFYRGETRYTGTRWKNPTVFVMYRDRPRKVTEEPYCLHLEWVLCGRQTPERAGFESVLDVLTIDPRQFWRQRLSLFEIDAELLGRRYHNQRIGSRRIKPWVLTYGKRFSYHMDLRCGGTILRGFRSAQAIVDDDKYGRDLVEPCLSKLNCDHLLPGTHSYDNVPKSPRSVIKPSPASKLSVFHPCATNGVCAMSKGSRSYERRYDWIDRSDLTYRSQPPSPSLSSLALSFPIRYRGGDVKSFLKRLILYNPDASVDALVLLLREQGIEISALTISTIRMKFSSHLARFASRRVSGGNRLHHLPSSCHRSEQQQLLLCLSSVDLSS